MSRDGSLPPGVTGREYEIAGPDREWDDYRECSSEGFTVLTLTGYGKNQIAQAIEDVLKVQRTITQSSHQDNGVGDIFIPAPDLSGLTVAVSRLRNALSDVQDVDVDGQCPFGGDVTLQVYNGIESWECPACRTLHETEVE